MHTVALTHAFVRAAKQTGMTEDEIDTVVDCVSKSPTAGAEIAGTGGCRKLRAAERGKGKSGGYRIITFYTGEALPVFLLTVFAKGERANLTRDESNKLRAITKAIVAEYRAKDTEA